MTEKKKKIGFNIVKNDSTDGHGGFGGDCFHYNINAVYNGVFLKYQLHNVDNFLSVYLGRKNPSVVEDINTFRRNRSRGCGFV